MTAGIIARHTRSCATKDGGGCNCKPAYRAEVYDRRSGRKIRKTFHNFSEAKSWRHDAASAISKGTLRAPSRTTVREAGGDWIQGARSGAVRTRAGERYKPSTIRGYEAALMERIYPELGARRLSDLQRQDVQDLADRLLAEGLDASTIRNALMPLRAIYRRAVARGVVAVNPTSALELPAVRGRRDRIASPQEAKTLLAALPERDRALWATAMYAGLRRGELMALRVVDVDLEAGRIRVERSYDPKEKAVVQPKSEKGRRTVPMPAVLRPYLAARKLELRWSGGLFFGRTAELPFDDSSLNARASTAWKNLTPITLHEARHTYASLMIAAGVNAKALSTYMGHSSITITLDRYGHLLPGNEAEAADLLDAYLERVGQLRASEGQ